MTKAVSDWLALAIEDLDEKTLLPGLIGKDGTQPHLPTKMVKMPFENPNQVAIVSWRWDGDLKTKGSRNIASVVHIAKQRGIKYLLIDIISIDQTLPASDLIKLVAAFSTLYTKIKVLAAYDMVDNPGRDMRYTMLRPWILNEIRLFRHNPGTIVYVGHSDKGSRCLLETHPNRSQFDLMVDVVWSAGFINSILGVLNAQVGMAVISDFTYILPAYSHVFSVAYKQMERNDYLLTVAVLCGRYEICENLVGYLEGKGNIQDLSYSRYSFTIEWHDEAWSHTFYEIFLDGTRVAGWEQESTVSHEYNMFHFKTFSNAERVIFKALCLPEADYEEFLHQEEARYACLTLDDSDDVPRPPLEAIEVRSLFE